MRGSTPSTTPCLGRRCNKARGPCITMHHHTTTPYMAPPSLTLAAWLRSKGYWIDGQADKSARASLTHVFLNGGKACLPPEARAEFLDVYARIVASGGASSLYAVERSGTTYRMFADMDVPLPEGTTNAEGDALIREILGVALANVPTVLRAGDVTLCSRPSSGGKVGAHLIWSDALRVDDGQALDARATWVASCAAAADRFDWDSIIDAAVYKRNGLRMPWSMKRGGDQRSSYRPECKYRFPPQDGEPVVVDTFDAVAGMADEREVRRWLEMTTLAGEGHGVGKEEEVQRQRKKRRAAVEGGGGGGAGVGEGGAGGRAGGRAGGGASASSSSSSSPLLARDEARLRAVLPAPYEGCAFTNASVGEASVAISTDSRYCLNAGREHTSNHVFFVVKRDGALYQHCYSSKCKGASQRVGKGCPMRALAIRALPAQDEGGNNTKQKKKKSKAAVDVRPVSAAAAAARWASSLLQVQGR